MPIVKTLAGEVAQPSISSFVGFLLKVQATLTKMNVIKTRSASNLNATIFMLALVILKLEAENVSSKPSQIGCAIRCNCDASKICFSHGMCVPFKN